MTILFKHQGKGLSIHGKFRWLPRNLDACLRLVKRWFTGDKLAKVPRFQNRRNAAPAGTLQAEELVCWEPRRFTVHEIRRPDPILLQLSAEDNRPRGEGTGQPALSC
jgi:hypothetical protein